MTILGITGRSLRQVKQLAPLRSLSLPPSEQPVLLRNESSDVIVTELGEPIKLEAD